MGMVVRSNLAALNSNRQLGMNNNAVSKGLEKLSSGFRINRAGDDASGLAISEKMKAQIKGLEQASSNAQDGISLVQTAEGAMTEVHNMLNRMVELATKSANGTIADDVDRDAIQSEVNQLLEEIDRIGDATNFNGINLLDGSLGDGFPKAAATVGGQEISAKENAGLQSKATLALTATTADKGELTFTMADGSTKALSWSGLTNAGVTANAVLTALQNDSDWADVAKEYEIEANGQDLIMKSKNAGAAHTAITGNAVASGGTVNGAAAITGSVAGTDNNSTIKLDSNLAAGDKIEIGGKTYTMAAANDIDKNEFSTFAGLQALAARDGYTIATTGGAGAEMDAAETLTVTAKAGTSAGGLTLQVGDTNDNFNKVTVSVDDVRTKGLAINGLKVDTEKAAGESIKTIKNAINKVSTNRGNLGALQNRLEYAINNLDVTAENMTSANSRIRDTDMAKQMMDYTKMNVLTQSAQAMLAQANQQPQSILQLLQ